MSKHPVLALRFHQRVVACHAPAAELAWLEEFLAPWFERASPSEAQCRVDWCRDDDLVHALCEDGAPAQAQPADAFAMDRGMQVLPRWRDASGASLVFDAMLGTALRVREEGVHFEVLHGASALRARVALMRVVRELAMSELREARRLLVHGAMVSGEGRGILVAGPKQAGKTTLLVHGLMAGARFVSNDRVVLERRAGGVRVRGMPTIVSVRPATLEILPSLSGALEGGRYDHLHTLSEIASGQAPPRPRPGRPRHLSAAQLCRVLDAVAQREAALDTVVLLRTGAAPGARLRPLARSEATRRLEDCRFGTSDRSSALFPAPPDAEAPAAAEVPAALGAREVVEGARCFDLELGIGTDVEAIRSVLAELLA